MQKSLSPLVGAVILVSVALAIGTVMSGSFTSVFKSTTSQTTKFEACTDASMDIFNINCRNSVYEFLGPNLLAYWPFDNANASNYTLDSTNYANDAQLGGGDSVLSPQFSSGKTGNALRFDGINDYVNASNIQLSNFSIILWAKNTTPIYNERVLLTKGINNISYRISVLPNGRFKFMIQNASHNFTRIGNLSLNTTDSIEPAVIDPKGEYAYFGTQNIPGEIFKVRLSDFTEVAKLTLNAGEDDLNSVLIDPKGEYAYFGTDTSPAKIIKIRLSDFTEVDTLTFNAGENRLDSPAFMDPEGKYAYFITYTNPNKIVKINLQSFTETASKNLSSNSITSAVIDPKGEYAYLTSNNFPSTSRIIKFKISDLTEVANLSLSSVTYISSSVIDPDGNYLYVAASSPIEIAKIRLSDFSEVDNITINVSTNFYTGVIDPKGEYAYFATYLNAPKDVIIKLRLSDLTETDRLTIENPGEQGIYSSVIDPKGEYAYFALYDKTIIKIKLLDLTMQEVTSSSTISDSFKEIGAVRNSTNISLYINGVKENTTTATITPNNSENIKIGSGGQWWAGYGRAGNYFSTAFPGALDEIRIYNITLKDSEISQHYNDYKLKLSVLNTGSTTLKNITVFSRIGTNTWTNVTPITLKPGESALISTSVGSGELSQLRVSTSNCPIYIEKTNETVSVAKCE